jgi:serine/threonine protein kinase
MAYIHSADIVHEDMKLENVMVINTLDGPLIKVIDFGLGHKVTEPSIAKGSDAYQSPETIMNLERNPIKSDIWACGIILFSMLTSRLPFDKETVRQELIQMNDQGRRSMLRRIAVGTFQYREVENQQLSTECKQVIQHMLTRNQEYRMNASELLQLEWFKNI